MRVCRGSSGRLAVLFGLCGMWLAQLVTCASAGDAPIHPDRPYSVTLDPRPAQFVRLVFLGTSSGNEPCIDELEVYGPSGSASGDAGENQALSRGGAKAAASSCLSGYPQHAVAHLNDGEYGNERSWIPAGVEGEWAQIKLAERVMVSRVVISRDRSGHYGDRVPTHFEVRLSVDGLGWETVRRVKTRSVGGVRGGGVSPLKLPAPAPAPALGRDGKLLSALTPQAQVPREDELGFSNLALNPQAKPAASSVYADGGLAIHQVAHLNDGLAGNEHSWISKQEPSWAQIDLGGEYWVYRVAFASDALGEYRDRGATSFEILTATSYDADSEAGSWRSAYKRSGGPPTGFRAEFKFEPVRARWVRIVILGGQGGACRIDELEVFGRDAPIALSAIGPVTAPSYDGGFDSLLRSAFVKEEHAWLKTYGRADLDPGLVPYNGRVREYPRHVGEDRLPLPAVSSAPVLDGALEDACWSGASRGTVRVARPDDFERGPLVRHCLWAARHGGDLCMALQVDRLLSRHIAVVATGDWQSCGIVVLTDEGLVFRAYGPDGDGNTKLLDTKAVKGAFASDLTCFEVRLPLAWFPDCRDVGLRVGLGMGGLHTASHGRVVSLGFAPLALAEYAPYAGGRFRVRVSAPAGGEAINVTGEVPELQGGVRLAPGESRDLSLVARRGPIGPEYDLTVRCAEAGEYDLHLFRYDPLERCLSLMGGIVDRLALLGLNVAPERRGLEQFRDRQRELVYSGRGDAGSERAALLEARMAKRRVLLRSPELVGVARVLFVKRHAYHPSHIYTDYTDAPFRPGGGVCVLEVPRREGRLAPASADLTTLFDAGGGIARDPAATFDVSRIYFGYRPSADGFYHMMAMRADGGQLRQLTDGPYHDFYPCPLPDGDVAFISTRCTARVFCFRGPSSVLFRMDSEGRNARALSFASLSEWAPSVMRDGRIIWTRWEYVDKGADFTQTLWSIRPDGSYPELVFGNTIIQPNGYASGRQVPGSGEISCALVSHFGDINGPVALLDPGRGRMEPKAIESLTPEVPWPGMWPARECFRDPVPLSRDYFLCSHAPGERFGLFVIDRFGNRELLYMDPVIDCMGPTLLQGGTRPPVIPCVRDEGVGDGQFILLDIYQGLGARVARGSVKYLRVVEEVRHNVALTPNRDHADFMKWYASPVDVVGGPHGWPSYVAKAPLGIVPVQEDGSARFRAPAGKTLYFQALDGEFNEVQRMRSVVQLQPGEARGCIGCHEARQATPSVRRPASVARESSRLQAPSWGAGPFSFEDVVQPVLDANCVGCHTEGHASGIDLSGATDAERVPASYRTLVSRGLVHVVDCGWNSGGCEKREPLTFGTVKSKLWTVLDGGHHEVSLTRDEMIRIKTWTDLNCPLWPDYVERSKRPARQAQAVSVDARE